MAGGIRFLSVDDVVAIHEDTLAHEGGAAGLRDPALLESAVMMPQQQFGGRYLHEGLAAMAAAYLFHIVSNHPFIDGNKRAGAMSALVFLDANAARRLPRAKELEAATLAVAAGGMTKNAVISWMRRQISR